MTHQVILADPPWAHYGAQDKWGAAAKFYPTMPDQDIFALPVSDWLTKPGVLFLWATCPRLDMAIETIEQWGLHYRGVAQVWVKTKKSDPLVPIGAQGVRPSVVKPTTELLLVASTERLGRPLPLADEGVPQVLLAPKREHSRKPDETYERIERLYPEATKLELFARPPHRPGWDVWGLEAQSATRTTA